MKTTPRTGKTKDITLVLMGMILACLFLVPVCCIVLASKQSGLWVADSSKKTRVDANAADLSGLRTLLERKAECEIPIPKLPSVVPTLQIEEGSPVKSSGENAVQ